MITLSYSEGLFILVFTFCIIGVSFLIGRMQTAWATKRYLDKLLNNEKSKKVKNPV